MQQVEETQTKKTNVISKLEADLDNLERDTLLYFREKMGLRFPPEYNDKKNDLLKKAINQKCDRTLEAYKL